VSNIAVAKELLRLFGLSSKETELIQHVEDRQFNDCRYWIDSKKLHLLGWKPQVSFTEGLKTTSMFKLFLYRLLKALPQVDWYRANPNYWEDVDYALTAHPARRINTAIGYAQKVLK